MLQAMVCGVKHASVVRPHTFYNYKSNTIAQQKYEWAPITRSYNVT